MQNEILAHNHSKDVRVYVVWFNMLAGDSRQAWSASLVHDPRSVHLWDPNRSVGRWFATNVDGFPGISWDAYYLFGRDARWDGKPVPMASSGSTVVSRSGKLKNDFARLTAAG